MGKLSATAVKAATRPGRLGDGDGLFLVIQLGGGSGAERRSMLAQPLERLNACLAKIAETVGGLRVDEASGAVKALAGGVVPGLYAAGRTAIGICSSLYVSGLSFADCRYSGRRAARSIARGGSQKLGSGPIRSLVEQKIG